MSIVNPLDITVNGVAPDATDNISLDLDDISGGTVDDSQVPESAVTQHQAFTSIGNGSSEPVTSTPRAIAAFGFCAAKCAFGVNPNGEGRAISV